LPLWLFGHAVNEFGKRYQRIVFGKIGE